MPYNNYPSPYPAIPANGYMGGMPYQAPPLPPYPQQQNMSAYQPQPAQMFPAPPPVMQPVRQNNMVLDWVQGPEAASAYYVEPGKGAILMDINRRTFYLTSRGEDNIPRPLQTFDYYQRQPQQLEQAQPDHIMSSDYQKLDRRIRALEDSIQSSGAPLLTASSADSHNMTQQTEGQANV